jgi:rhodanese-related sulfurtransferase
MDPGVNDIVVVDISPGELRSRLETGEGLELLDVREPAELAGELGSLENSLNIPIGSLVGRLSELEPMKDSEVVVVCRTGGRAHTAAQILMQQGFSSVRVLDGGITAWRAELET